MLNLSFKLWHIRILERGLIISCLGHFFTVSQKRLKAININVKEFHKPLPCAWAISIGVHIPNYMRKWMPLWLVLYTMVHIHERSWPLYSGSKAAVVLLDQSAAFDTIDHNTLMDCLSTWFGVGGKCLSWFKSYLTDRSQCIKIGSVMSDVTHLKYGVPQGSVLGPILFFSIHHTTQQNYWKPLRHQIPD